MVSDLGLRGNRWSSFGSGVLWLGGRLARWWARRLLCGSGEMFKPVPEPLKVSGQARAFVFPVCDHSEDDL